MNKWLELPSNTTSLWIRSVAYFWHKTVSLILNFWSKRVKTGTLDDCDINHLYFKVEYFVTKTWFSFPTPALWKLQSFFFRILAEDESLLMCSSAPNLAIFIRNSRRQTWSKTRKGNWNDTRTTSEDKTIWEIIKNLNGFYQLSSQEVVGYMRYWDCNTWLGWTKPSDKWHIVFVFYICVLYLWICIFVLHSRVGVGPSGVMNSIVRPPVWFKMRHKWGLNPHFYPMECLWFDPKSIYFYSFLDCKYILLVTNVYLIKNKKIEFATHPPKNNKKIIIICSQSIKSGWLYTESVIIEKCHPCTFYKVKNSQYSFPLGTES